MKRSGPLAKITVADFIARSGYQMGKTPVLPLFAASLGANTALVGMIVSVSTLTGMCLKPLVGSLSDHWGRRGWLLAGTAFFAAAPFGYRWVQSPEQLLVMRLVHGLATAIYGPVTLALVAEWAGSRRAERLGWFGTARSGGYLVGPPVAAWLLSVMDPTQVFTVIGLVSCLAFVPVALVISHIRPVASRPGQGRLLAGSLLAATRSETLWQASAVEALVFTSLYSVKAFLPLFALAAGVHVVVVGLFFAIQEGAHLLVRPLGGRFGDRRGHRVAIAWGMGLVAVALALVPLGAGSVGLALLAALMGAGQAFIFPSTLAVVAAGVDGRASGAAMGLFGTCRNAGKVCGPLLGGLCVHRLGFAPMFYLASLVLVGGALAVTSGRWVRHHRPQPDAYPAATGPQAP